MLKKNYFKILLNIKYLKKILVRLKTFKYLATSFFFKRKLLSNTELNNYLDKNKPEKGFIYIAFGNNFFKECINSVKILKSKTDLPISLFTDIQNITNSERDLFYSIKQVKSIHLRSKVDYIHLSPFEKTIYLDTDIIVVKNIDELFILLERYDFIATLDTARKRKNIAELIEEYDKIPYVYGELNGGLLGFNQYAKQNIINKWSSIFYKYMHLTNGWDQPSLRILLWKYKASLFILPPEYNVRSKDLLKKIETSKDKLGHDHMEPRVYHMHIFKEIHEKDKNYDFIPKDEIIRIAKENAYKINY